MRNLLRVLPALMVMNAASCSSKPETIPVHPVSGQVFYDGKPAAGVRVFLFPMDAPCVPDIPSNPRGVTGADGRFTISTFGDGDGAAEGTYRVVLNWPAEAKEGDEEKEDRLLDWYDAKHTKYEIRVKAATNDLPPFKLPLVTGPPGALEGIPGRN